HFSGVLELWQAGGALTIEGIELEAESLDFRVVRCGYMEMYAQMGLPKALHATLSCRRDAAFAAGYSPKLLLDRPEVISAGAPACLFRFRWQG
ncbi:MAG TPA: L-2-amino-thiazoline-4-carboxylic acid hydrolase, partial [Humidesulfovibrio sp.]|uniref:L-2-amino-thiazoline-4-carboxylic acid hydrolase n=1 Tax=Humidesulfovibrio sp. TaxID=2910988 RepID=UPI002BFFD037